ncbi:MAG TPA: hypothetical protein VKX46_16690 [Ktedonobacteraceae bacterium]|nr:hypothetical protein [Ktedonobacteraceae bacterium]
MTEQGRLKNWAANVEARESMAIIRQALGKHGIRTVRFVASTGGKRLDTLTFPLVVKDTLFQVRMTIDLDHVEDRVRESYGYRTLTDLLIKQVYRTAWANLRDFVLSALAAVDSNVSKLEEVFFAFIVANEQEKTFFQMFEERLALPEPKVRQTSQVTIVEE